jgi:hypothetical protein
MNKACTGNRLGVIAVLLAVMLLAGCGQKVETPTEGNKLIVGYAEGVTAVEDPDAFAKVLDKVYEESQEPGIALEYKSVAYSTNGTDFSCYLANAADNQYDMFIAIYADDALTDEVFLSGLLRPGTAFDHITLSHALPLGQTHCTVAFTQIEVVDGEQTIHDQALIGVEFYVTKG